LDEREQHPSNSQIQQAAEKVMMERLGVMIGATLESAVVDLGDGVRIQVDGVSRQPPVLVEASARQGKPRGAQFRIPPIRSRLIRKLESTGTDLPTAQGVEAVHVNLGHPPEISSQDWRAAGESFDEIG